MFGFKIDKFHYQSNGERDSILLKKLTVNIIYMSDIFFGLGTHMLENDGRYFKWASNVYYLYISNIIKNIELDILSEVDGEISFLFTPECIIKKNVVVGKNLINVDLPTSSFNKVKITQPYIIPSIKYDTEDCRKLSYRIYEIKTIDRSDCVKTHGVETIKFNSEDIITNSMVDFRNLTIETIKEFDGVYNYFNPSHLNGKTVIRRESKFENKLLVSDIVDDKLNIILQNHVDDNFIFSYEDARFINDDEISVCCCKRDRNTFEIINIEFKKYNLFTKAFTHYKTQNACFEKHWQFINDKIIYHVNPYTVLDLSENVIFKKNIDWNPWIDKFGYPGLSTNVFEVDSQKYILFHSYVPMETLQYKYYIGLMKLDDELNPICYFDTPFLVSDKLYTDKSFTESYWVWKKTEFRDAVTHEVIFPMNIVVDDTNINIYSGLNDCLAANIKVNKVKFIEAVSKHSFTLV